MLGSISEGDVYDTNSDRESLVQDDNAILRVDPDPSVMVNSAVFSSPRTPILHLLTKRVNPDGVANG